MNKIVILALLGAAVEGLVDVVPRRLDTTLVKFVEEQDN